MGIRNIRLMLCVVGVAIAARLADARAAPIDKESRVRCESREGRWNQCALPPGNGDVVILRQLSRNACIRNQSWGVDDARLWVARGCRAEFAREQAAPGAPATRTRLLRCESRNGGYRHCPIATSGGVRLNRKLSSGECELGASWGYDEQGIWVSRGCRAEFEVVTATRPSVRFFQRMFRRNGPAANAGIPVRCESIDGVRRECRLPAGTVRLELVQQLSRATCNAARNWGWDAHKVWVSEGCRAEFIALPQTAPE